MDQPLWSDGLTEEQATAASQTGSHARLLAGPGTGKTHTLARRVVYLVTQENISPSEILILTFTRMAARDLRSKIRDHLAPYTDEMPHISTLHSFALRQLRRNADAIDALPQPLRIADDWEEAKIIQEDIKTLLGRNLSEVKNGFNQLSADWETLRADEAGWREALPDPPFIGTWEEHRNVYGYTLRAELVYQLKRALSQVPGFVLEPGFRHVLIDEYQDLNPCDLAVAAEVAAKGAMLLACGDDDQSIYGFRFADPGGIRDFIAEFPDSADLQLTECQRCDPAILEAALWVARLDRDRVDKELRAVAGRDPGEVHLLGFATGQSEAQGVARLCKHLIDRGTTPGEILILIRSDRNGVFSRPLEAALLAEGVAVTTGTETQGILEEIQGRRLLSMLQLIANPNDHLAWRTRLEVAEGIGPSTTRPIYDFAIQEGIAFSAAIHRLPEFADRIPAATLRTLQGLVANTLATGARHRAEVPNVAADEDRTPEDLVAMVQVIAESEIAEEEKRDEVVTKLEEIIATSEATTISDLLLSVAIGREALEPELDQDAVNILTMHKAKGLSADAVFIVAAEDEILPQADVASAVADDRRLLYVSMTRARHELFITYSGRRAGQQVHTGRNSGDPRRQLTRFLRNSPLRAQNGEIFVDDKVNAAQEAP